MRAFFFVQVPTLLKSSDTNHHFKGGKTLLAFLEVHTVGAEWMSEGNKRCLYFSTYINAQILLIGQSCCDRQQRERSQINSYELPVTAGCGIFGIQTHNVLTIGYTLVCCACKVCVSLSEKIKGSLWRTIVDGSSFCLHCSALHENVQASATSCLGSACEKERPASCRGFAALNRCLSFINSLYFHIRHSLITPVNPAP